MINIIMIFLFLVAAAALMIWFLGVEVTLPLFERLIEKFPGTFTGDTYDTYQFIEAMSENWMILFVIIGGLIWVIYESLWRKHNAYV